MEYSFKHFLFVIFFSYGGAIKFDIGDAAVFGKSDDGSVTVNPIRSLPIFGQNIASLHVSNYLFMVFRTPGKSFDGTLR